MLFHSQTFFYFFCILYTTILITGHRDKRNTPQTNSQNFIKYFLLIGSYYFYANWDYRFLSLIILSTFIDFFVGKKIGATENPKQRKRYLLFSLTTNLGILGFFKYHNFFIESANLALSSLNLSLPYMSLILPIGISFYTFQSMSYSLDIYRDKLTPTISYLDFSIYVAFFPQLIAGPIVRAREFLPQLAKPILLKADNFFRGLQIFLYGVFLKTVIADNIAPVVDTVFKNPSAHSCLDVWIAVIGYSFQIFCDFYGYSEMAIGLALILGFTLPTNFRFPYLATSLFEFWRRWHISLSSWLRDYLYIPLGGNRNGFASTSRNVIITFALGGLWHGASLNFVLWGLFHGFGLFINKVFQTIRIKSSDNRLSTLIKWALTYFFVCMGWVIFRSENFGIALEIYKKLFEFEGVATSLFILSTYQVYIISTIIGIHGWHHFSQKDSFHFTPGSLGFYFYTLTLLGLIFIFSSKGYTPFIYFQF